MTASIVPLGSPVSIEVEYAVDFDASPIVSPLRGFHMRVTRVLVTEFPGSDDEPVCRARGYAVKANGERDYRFNRLVSATSEIDAAYLAEHLRQQAGIR